jgi:hypothetical protein
MFSPYHLAEILSGALKENQCNGLLKLIDGPADGGTQERSRPESRKASSSLRGRSSNSKAGRLVA